MNYLRMIGISLAISVIALFSFYYFIPIEPIEVLSGDNMLGATITTIQGSDTLKNSRSVINTNFANLNSDKIETATTSLPLITTLSGLTSASSLATVGTITSGTWNATPLTVSYGGTGSTTLTQNAVLYGNGTSGILGVPAGSEGQVLTLTSGVPVWGTSAVNEAVDYSWTGEHTFSATTTFSGISYGLDYGIFGSGEDGASTTEGDFTLTEDMYFTDWTINASTTVNTAGYRVYVKNDFNNLGTISNNGSDASGVTGGTAGATGSLLGGGAGGNGGTVVNTGGGGGGGGGVLFVFANNVINQGALTANGGNGGNAVGTAANGSTSNGTAGTAVTNGVVNSAGGTGGAGGGTNGGAVTNVRTISEGSVLILNSFIDPMNVAALGAGGGGGGGQVPTGQEFAYGGGGGGGGTIIFVYRTITTTGTTSVTAGSAGANTGSPGGTQPAAGTAGKVITLDI